MRLSSLILICTVYTAFAQEPGPKRGDFMCPVRPNEENYLSGTMGELRKTHFHTGIDIKTSGITGLPIYASADGYIQRIRVSTGGYGNALYMVHPHNNTVTVYAHLKSFDEAIAAFVREKQYEKQSFEINLFPDKEQFVFKQGDVIALSGNSGSSSGPHLHFEIRTKEHKALDPLRFGFKEIDDTTPPVLDKVAFVTMDVNARINGGFGRFEFDVVKGPEGSYVLDNAVILKGNIGVEVYAYDRFDRARNRNGILYQTLVLDDEVVFDQAIDHLSFGKARNILVHTNYKRSSEGGRRFNKMYIDNGNDLPFYETGESKGAINISDPLKHELTIRLVDSYENVSQYKFDLNGNGEMNLENKIYDNLDEVGYEVDRGILEFRTDLSDYGYCEGLLYTSGQQHKVQMAYDQGDLGYYLWDLRKGLPDSILICNDRFVFDFKGVIPSKRKGKWQSDSVEIDFPANSLFDTLFIRYDRKMVEDREVFAFNNQSNPIHRNVSITLRPALSYDQEKTSVYTLDGRGNLGFMGGEWKDDAISFKCRDLVPFTLAIDTIAPSIAPVKTKKEYLKFRIDDDRSGIKEYRATLNGNWLLMNYDPKSKSLWSDEKVEMSGDFYLEVTDQMDNVATFKKFYPLNSGQ